MGIETLNEDLELNIPMFDDDMDIIAKLDDEPNAVGGLTAAELKAEFDRPGKTIKKYLNETLVPSLIGTVAEESVRAQNEYIRVTNENQRVANENGRVEEEERRNNAELERVENEDSRGDNETKRVQAETARAAAEAQRESAEQAREDKTSGIVAQATEQANEAKNQADRAEEQAKKAGDEADRAAEQANLARQVKSMQAEATTLSAGSEATAKVEEENGDLVLRVGIPVGRDGKDGQDGQAGPAGADGKDGVTYTPSVTSAGVLSWTNDGGRQNPSSVNIKGPAGADGVGIKSVVQTELSTEDQGRNTMRVTKTDGTTTDFYVFNGRRGSTGPVGQPGKDGRNGAPGKSAYEYAKDGGFTGTEEEFAELLANGNGGGADWDQNDPEGAGYVKGRTHWYDEDGFHPLNGRFLPDSVPWVENYATDILSCEVLLDDNGEAKLDVRPEIFEGGEYVVSWNGAEFNCEARAFEENGAYIGMAIGSGDPFTIILVTVEMVETVGASFLVRGSLDYARTVVDLRISKRGIYYQKLQKELLPDDVPFVYATKQSLTEEQKAQARENIGVENVLESVGGDTLTWDGNTEGRESIDFGYGYICYKVSNSAPSFGDFTDFVLVYVAPEGNLTVDVDVVELESGAWCLVNGVTILAFFAPSDVEGEDYGVVATKGTYFPDKAIDGIGRTSSLTIPGYTGFAKKQIKTEYIPESVPQVQTASVGQTIVVSEVDAEGKPTKWEAATIGATAPSATLGCMLDLFKKALYVEDTSDLLSELEKLIGTGGGDSGGSDTPEVPDLPDEPEPVALPSWIQEMQVVEFTPEADTNEVQTFAINMENEPNMVIVRSDIETPTNARDFVGMFAIKTLSETYAWTQYFSVTMTSITSASQPVANDISFSNSVISLQSHAIGGTAAYWRAGHKYTAYCIRTAFDTSDMTDAPFAKETYAVAYEPEADSNEAVTFEYEMENEPNCVLIISNHTAKETVRDVVGYLGTKLYADEAWRSLNLITTSSAFAVSSGADGGSGGGYVAVNDGVLTYTPYKYGGTACYFRAARKYMVIMMHI